MGTEVVNLQLVLYSDALEIPVNHLETDDGPKSVEKARASIILDTHRGVAITNVPLKALVDSDDPPFSRLLFPLRRRWVRAGSAASAPLLRTCPRNRAEARR